MSDFRIRSKGRHKLKLLCEEALDVCAKYQHDEYAVEFRRILVRMREDAICEIMQKKTQESTDAKAKHQ